LTTTGTAGPGETTTTTTDTEAPEETTDTDTATTTSDEAVTDSTTTESYVTTTDEAGVVTFLPRTGADLTRLLAVAASAIVLGALLVGLSTRRSGRRH
jgi:hypothetical protein